MNKRFTNPEFFGQIGQPPLVSLLDRFAPEFAAQEIHLPAPELEEKQYCKEVSLLSASKKGFPIKLIDVLYGIAAMANEEGKDRLIRAGSEAGVQMEFGQDATCEEFAVRFYLSAPNVFERKVRETQILARSSFQVFGTRNPSPAGIAFARPRDEQLERFKADVDEWVASEYRGEERATQIEYYDMGDEHLFLLRIGDSRARQAVVEGDTFTYHHFRPARDLVVSYSPVRDEVRINGKGSKKIRMLRETFGRRFFGEPDRFSVRDPFTLSPLARLGRAALEVTPGRGIARIVLTEIVQEGDSEPGIRMQLKGPDFFEFSERENMPLFWPRCRVTGAGFDVYFTGQSAPRQFFLREGNGLRQVRNCDAAALYRWMTEKGFRKIRPDGVTNGDEPVGEN